MWAAAMPAGSHPKESFGNDLHSAGRVPRRCLPGSWRCQVRRGSAHGEGRMSRLVTWNAIEYLRSIFSRRYHDNWLIDDKFPRCLECRLNVFFFCLIECAVIAPRIRSFAWGSLASKKQRRWWRWWRRRRPNRWPSALASADGATGST